MILKIYVLGETHYMRACRIKKYVCIWDFKQSLNLLYDNRDYGIVNL